MRYTKLEICNTIARTWALNYGTLTPDEQTALNVNLNTIIEDICVAGKIPMLKKWGIINAIAQYNTGTVQIATAGGISTVTGNGTAWTTAMEGRKILFTGFATSYTINTVTNGTSLTLVEVFVNTVDNTSALSTDNAYTIVKDTYDLASDFASFAEREVFDLTGGVRLDVKDSVDFDNEQPNRSTLQNPNLICLRGLSSATPGVWSAQIDPKPITPRLIKYAYYRMLDKLVNDTDTCALPIQNAIISGGTYKMALTKESDKSTKIDQFFKLYERDLELLRNAGRVPAQYKGMRPGVV